jgi:hypothetical protein
LSLIGAWLIVSRINQPLKALAAAAATSARANAGTAAGIRAG